MKYNIELLQIQVSADCDRELLPIVTISYQRVQRHKIKHYITLKKKKQEHKMVFHKQNIAK